jgi:hypothetical protein
MPSILDQTVILLESLSVAQSKHADWLEYFQPLLPNTHKDDKNQSNMLASSELIFKLECNPWCTVANTMNSCFLIQSNGNLGAKKN